MTGAAAPSLAFEVPRSPRYHALDLWRGLACLLVVVFHSTSVAFLTAEAEGFGASDPVSVALLRLTRVGWIGVPFFFVISGYAISATADVFRRRTGGAGTYFLRRFRRIYPPYWAMVGLQVVILLVVDVILAPKLLTSSIAPIDRPWTFSLGQWVGNLTLTESWRATILPNAAREYVLGQAWTLCYEEQFYVVTGLAILARPARFFRIASLVTLITVLVTVLAPVAGVRVHGFFVDGYWIAFAAGILVYWQINYGERAHLARTWLLLGAGIVYAALVFGGRGEMGRDLASAMLFAMALLALHRFDARVPEMPALRPLAFAGMICYSLYLSHAVVVRSISQALFDLGVRGPAATVAIVLPVCVAVAVLVGWALHRVVERRFLNRPSLSTAPGVSAVPVAPAAPAAP